MKQTTIMRMISSGDHLLLHHHMIIFFHYLVNNELITIKECDLIQFFMAGYFLNLAITIKNSVLKLPLVFSNLKV